MVFIQCFSTTFSPQATFTHSLTLTLSFSHHNLCCTHWWMHAGIHHHPQGHLHMRTTGATE